jgi:hypothetical protein
MRTKEMMALHTIAWLETSAVREFLDKVSNTQQQQLLLHAMQFVKFKVTVLKFRVALARHEPV